MKSAALVTLAIGHHHHAYWQNYFRASWEAYAAAQGYDLIVVTDPLDSSALAQSRSPAWQKCLVLSQPFAANYRQVVLLDCDILINPASPPITDQVNESNVGGVIAGSHIATDYRALLLSQVRNLHFPYEEGAKRLSEDQSAYYQHFGLSPMEAGIVQTGVLVASPTRHREMFESVYHTFTSVDHRTFEQIPLSHALLSAGVFHQIDSRFNSVFYETMRIYYPYLNDTHTPSYELLVAAAVKAQYAHNFFLHFAYVPHFAAFAHVQGPRA